MEFDLTNPDFVSAYFDMHHRMEAKGVDFWWLDWQQGGVTVSRDSTAVGAQPLALPGFRALRDFFRTQCK